MKRTLAILCFVAFMAGISTFAGADPIEPNNMPDCQFKMAMRKLWEDHITWTRLYIVSAIAGLEDTQNTAERLLKNQEDIGNAIKPYYGEAAGTKLTGLLRIHILTAAELVSAARAGDTAKVADANERWYSNVDEIAEFLSSANPNWSQKALTDMLHTHLDITKEETLARLSKNYAADIAAYDKVHDQALMMADTLADGIIKQFPDEEWAWCYIDEMYLP